MTCCGTSRAKQFSSPSGCRSRRKPSRAIFSISSSSRVICASGLNGEVVRADTDKKVGRLGARVQVIQDRIDDRGGEPRARLVESIETALRFGKDRINVIAAAERGRRNAETRNSAISNSEIRTSLLHRLALRALRSRYPPADARAVQFQQSARRLSGVPRLRPHDRDRSEPRDPGSSPEHRRRAWCARFTAQQFGESQKDLLRACAREEIDVRMPFEELPKADQDFVINGEKRGTKTPTWKSWRRTIAGTACADFSNGSRARPTKCTCAFCSAATALTPPVPIATADVSNRTR